MESSQQEALNAKKLYTMIQSLDEEMKRQNKRLEKLEIEASAKASISHPVYQLRIYVSDEEEFETPIDDLDPLVYSWSTPQPDDNIASIKMKILAFESKSDSDIYFISEEKVEKIFDVHVYLEIKKVKLAVVEFSDYVSVWCMTMCKARKNSGMEQISIWKKLKKLMGKKFVPQFYRCELFQKMQYMCQGDKSVEDYYKDMDLAIIKVEVEENEKATIAGFKRELNEKIANLMELHHYDSIEEMWHMTQKVEK